MRIMTDNIEEPQKSARLIDQRFVTVTRKSVMRAQHSSIKPIL